MAEVTVTNNLAVSAAIAAARAPIIRCHSWGNVLVWSGQGIHLWASGVHHGMKPLDNGVHINLGPQEWGMLATYYTDTDNILGLPRLKSTQHELLINWEDFSTPKVPHKFWRLLAKRLLDVKLPVIVFCQGGHGRTGTALAILLGLWGVKQPMAYVRSHYCANAGESLAQISYLDAVLTKCGLAGQVNNKTYDETLWTTPAYGQAFGGYSTYPPATVVTTYKDEQYDNMGYAKSYGHQYAARSTAAVAVAKQVAETLSAKEEEDAWWTERYGKEYIECADGIWRRQDQMTAEEIVDSQWQGDQK